MFSRSEAKSRIHLLVFLFGATILAVGLAYFQIRGAIYAPFKIAGRQTSEQSETESALSVLANQDTDGDGLTDFDEQFVYYTSAYLPDSDSDGFSDKEEIEAGSSPLDRGSVPGSVQSAQSNSLEKTFSLEELQLPKKETSQTGLFGEKEISAQGIRDLLVSLVGLSKDVVDKLDDKTLINLYNETKQETGIDLEALSEKQLFEGSFDVSQLRQILIEQGVDSARLEQVDDATLEQMFLQSLSE